MASPFREVVLIAGANSGLGFRIATVLLRGYGDRFYVFHIGSDQSLHGDQRRWRSSDCRRVPSITEAS